MSKVLTVLTPNQCQAGVRLWEATGYRSGGVRERSLRPWGQLELARGSPGLQGGWGRLVPELLDTQTRLDAAKELIGGLRAGCSPGSMRKGRESLGWVPGGRESLSCLAEWLGLVEAMAGSTERPSAGD